MGRSRRPGRRRRSGSSSGGALGRATYDDAMYWSLQVLRRFPAVAAAVAGRFDEILVDEAQDTSELQLACWPSCARPAGCPLSFL